MFIAALFTIARTWKEPTCPSVEGWVKKLWYIHTMEYYSTIKMNGIASVVVWWMDLESVIQKIKSERENTIYLCIYVESRKMVLMNLSAGQQWRHRHREQMCGHSRGRRTWDELKE